MGKLVCPCCKSEDTGKLTLVHGTHARTGFQVSAPSRSRLGLVEPIKLRVSSRRVRPGRTVCVWPDGASVVAEGGEKKVRPGRTLPLCSTR